ncbi:4-(cytidine 5'-diphospho)-2-C-methyl-D-erythritol kinase [Desertibaculum subflavum]|uniref:4-(cytidine 5'-diphospho)-2-C-methyl-D-erythritol kinase n=1 Tax=Desertibaculum subflavum TaxID=2268458 RepID=UPI000E6749C9
MSLPIRRAAPAKLNLYLHVTGRRPDGYHELDSLVAFLDLGDDVEVQAAPTLSLEVTGPMAAGAPADGDNLALRAARALARAYGVTGGARIVLEKRLPSAAGLGGGSADAAATLLALVELWQLPHEPARLAEIGLALGADLPVCLLGRAARMQGIGERLVPAPDLPPAGIVLLNPGLPLATRDVFEARKGAFSAPAALPATFGDLPGLADFLAGCGNDLEPAATALAPAVGTALQILRASPDVRLVRMAGSGATCYGLFDGEAAARRAFAGMTLPPGWWGAATAISPAPQV